MNNHKRILILFVALLMLQTFRTKSKHGPFYFKIYEEFFKSFLHQISFAWYLDRVMDWMDDEWSERTGMHGWRNNQKELEWMDEEIIRTEWIGQNIFFKQRAESSEQRAKSN